MKKKFNYLVSSLVLAFAGALSAFAQPKDMVSTLNNATTTVKTWTQPLVNLILVILGLVAVGRAVATYISSRRSQSGNGNEELLNMILTTIVAVAFIFLVNVLFFKS